MALNISSFHVYDINRHEKFYIIMSAIIPVIAILRTFNDDKKYNSEVIVNSLPLARTQIVLAKYIMALIILL